MNPTEAMKLTRVVFDSLPMEKFLNDHPDISERMIYELRDDLIRLLQDQAVKGTAGEARVFSLYVDGASQPQKKQGGIGGVIYLNDSEIENFAENIGEATNNEAEYSALIRGCELLQKYEPGKVYIFADSEFMVKQINGEYQVKNERMKKLYGKAMSVLQQFPEWTIAHVPRERNRRADQLSKQAILQGNSPRRGGHAQ